MELGYAIKRQPPPGSVFKAGFNIYSEREKTTPKMMKI